MILFGRTIAPRLLALIFGVIVLIVAAMAFTRSCDNRRNAAAQGRMDTEQGQAGDASNKDAIETHAARSEAVAASEGLTRTNERDIRAAPGADDRVNVGVKAAGRAALCRREAYRDDPKCKAVR